MAGCLAVIKSRRINEFILLCQLYFPIRKQRWSLALLSAIDFDILFIYKLPPSHDSYYYKSWVELSARETKSQKPDSSLFRWPITIYAVIILHSRSFLFIDLSLFSLESLELQRWLPSIERTESKDEMLSVKRNHVYTWSQVPYNRIWISVKLRPKSVLNFEPLPCEMHLLC